MIIFIIKPKFMNFVIVAHNIAHNFRITVRFSHIIRLVFALTFLNNRAIMTDMYNMEGYTVAELAELLKIKPTTVRQRLMVAKIKPKTKSPVYDPSALEAIRNVKPKGWPRKTPEK